MRRYFLHLSYNGKQYHGWQIQPRETSVQEVMERCTGLKLKSKICITGCGRTDTGVHARNYYAHFDYDDVLDTVRFVSELNMFLPDDIVVHDCWQVPSDIHARFDALSRTYHYYITTVKDPFHTEDAYYYYGDLDMDMMQKAADILFEYRDFTSFSKLHTQVKTNNCIIMEAKWLRKDNMMVFHIKADRFLRNMVRAIVGTLLDVGRKRMDLDGFRAVIENKNRCSAGSSMPAHALFLEDVEYPERVFKGSEI